jgi:phage terminase large subunit-like protein
VDNKARKANGMTHAETTQKYFDDVLATPSPYVTNEWIKKAALRQKNDLLRQNTPEFPYVWDPQAGETVVDFISCLTHLKGEFSGKPFILAPWQCAAVMCIFSWKEANDITQRRYRRFTLQCGKSSGKTTLSAALCIFMLCAAGDNGAEVVTAARATAQARLTFETARDVLRANPKVVQAFGLRILQHSILQPSTASTMQPVSSQGRSLAGKIISYGSIDEPEFHRDREVFDEISLGCDKRKNSLLACIGHCSEDVHSIGYELYQSAVKILDGDLADEKTFVMIFSAEGYDWTSDEAIFASNPNAGISSYLNTIREARDRAVAIPSLQSAYKSHLLCLWNDGDVVKKWLQPEQLTSCIQENKLQDFRFWHIGEHEAIVQPSELRPFVLGLERSSLQEKAALVLCCKNWLDGVEHYYLFAQHFEPLANSDAQLADAVLGQYRNHVGYGVTINDADGFNFKALAHDLWMAPDPKIEASGIACLPFAKNAKTFSPVMDFLVSLIISNRVHFSDETLREHLLAIHAHRDLNNNLFPRRADPEKPIDTAIAALYAIRAAMVPAFLAPPVASDVKCTFLFEDGSVSESTPDGLKQTFAPLAVKAEGSVGGDL